MFDQLSVPDPEDDRCERVVRRARCGGVRQAALEQHRDQVVLDHEPDRDGRRGEQRSGAEGGGQTLAAVGSGRRAGAGVASGRPAPPRHATPADDRQQPPIDSRSTIAEETTAQLGPFPYCATFDPSGRYVAVCDAGNDTVTAHQPDEDHGRLFAEPGAVLSLPPGTEPRQLVFHPTGELAYTNGESSLSPTPLGFDARQGTFTELDRVEMLTEEPRAATAGKRLGSAELVLDDTARYLYVSNRGTDTIAVFGVEEDPGRPQLLDQIAGGGSGPRHIALSPCGRFLYSAHQGSASVTQFAVDGKSGALRAIGYHVRVPAPTCIAFA
ncbi:lactonase family protein [Streptomyces sp. NPDC058464]|uniref:lactonase family protein n=1 Tax=Streptomyces sp. NPDC058464 TaxID=3346511 RepID=UPI003656B144